MDSNYYTTDNAIATLKKLGFEIIEKNDRENENNGIEDIKDYSLNQILYGPPGTGKTYKTIELALEIIAKKDEKLQKFLEENEDREALKKNLMNIKIKDK